MTSKALSDFVHKAVFQRQVKTVEDILRQARKSGHSTSREEIYRTVGEVCTPYKTR